MRSLIGTAKQLLLPLSVLMLFSTVAVLAGCNGGSDTPASDVHALFTLETPSGAPFPTDMFTVQDASQLTRRRVSLPAPDCAVRRSDCEDLGVINTLDGFHVQPRLSIPFDGLIDVTTVTRETVFLVRLGSTSCDGDEGCDEADDEGGRVIGINQVVWAPETHTLHAESDALLDQHTRYALIVTRGVRDQFDQPVGATEAFRQFRQLVSGEYQLALLDAMRAASGCPNTTW